MNRRSSAGLKVGLGWCVDGQPPTYEARGWAAPTSAVLSLAGWNLGRCDELRHDPRARRLAQLALRGRVLHRRRDRSCRRPRRWRCLDAMTSSRPSSPSSPGRGFTRGPRIADLMTREYEAFVDSANAAEHTGDAAAALEYHQGVPMFRRSAHRVVLAQLADLSEEMTPWLWARWAAYQCTRAGDPGHGLWRRLPVGARVHRGDVPRRRAGARLGGRRRPRPAARHDRGGGLGLPPDLHLRAPRPGAVPGHDGRRTARGRGCRWRGSGSGRGSAGSGSSRPGPTAWSSETSPRTVRSSCSTWGPGCSPGPAAGCSAGWSPAGPRPR